MHLSAEMEEAIAELASLVADQPQPQELEQEKGKSKMPKVVRENLTDVACKYVRECQRTEGAKKEIMTRLHAFMHPFYNKKDYLAQMLERRVINVSGTLANLENELRAAIAKHSLHPGARLPCDCQPHAVYINDSSLAATCECIVWGRDRVRWQSCHSGKVGGSPDEPRAQAARVLPLDARDGEAAAGLHPQTCPGKTLAHIIVPDSRCPTFGFCTLYQL